MRVARDDRHYYDQLFSLADMDALLSLSSVSAGQIRIVENGQTTSQAELSGSGIFGHVNAQERLYASFRRGATLNALAVHERWPRLRDLTRQLAAELSVAAQINAYLTPPGSRGLQPHRDTHDVIVIQISGSKDWQIFDAPDALPAPGSTTGQDPSQTTDPTGEFELHAGDLLYIPRGWKHAASAGRSASLHLTIGLFPLTWGDVLLYSLGSTIGRHEMFRKSLPLGFLRDGIDGAMKLRQEIEDLLPIVVNDMRSDLLFADIASAAGLGVAPVLDGHLCDLAMSPFIDETTRFRLRSTARPRLSHTGDAIALTFHGKVMTVPAHTEDDLREITSANGPFTARSLTGALDVPGRLVLLRRLVEEGLITISD